MIRPQAGDWLQNLPAIARKSGFAIDQFGEAFGLPLIGLRKPGAGGARRIYLSAGIHGDEPAGPLALERLLGAGFFDNRFSWQICPLLNPAGWDAGTRENPAGVDLNRDYRHARSIETRAHRAWLESQPPNDLYLSLHEDWEATGFYTYEINTSDFPGVAREVLDAVSAVIPLEPMSRIDNHEVTAPGLIHHEPEADEPENWPEAIFHLQRYPHLSYTFETPSTVDIAARIEAHCLAVKSAVERFAGFAINEGKTTDI